MLGDSPGQTDNLKYRNTLNRWIKTTHSCICGLSSAFFSIFCHHKCFRTLHPAPSFSAGELTCSGLHRLSLAVFMNTLGPYRLFLIKDIKRRALPEPWSTCFRHFHNMCCCCVQRLYGGWGQHSGCLQNQFTSKLNNLPTVDRVNISLTPFYRF